ncbi:MAG: hypothetical protein RL338_1863 [Chloroflexota bacterium]
MTPLLAGLAVSACVGSAPGPTPPPIAGTPDRPREIAIVAKDYRFLPEAVEVVPGETLVIHVVNGGLALHEVVIGDMAVQDAWERAEAATVGAPPGPTPPVVVPPELAGVRAVVGSGERVDLLWTVPADPAEVARLIVGCHIPGHWAKGMQVPVVVAAGG